MTSRKKIVAEDSGRIKRPVLDRIEPIRRFSTIVTGRAKRATKDSVEPSNGVQRGVELGYKVVDEYLKFGQGFAGMMATPASPRDASQLPQLTERMFRYASDFGSIWQEAMGILVANGRGGTPADFVQVNQRPFDPIGSPATRAQHENGFSTKPIGISIEIISARQTKASIDLRQAIVRGQTVALDDLPALTGKSFIKKPTIVHDVAEGRVTISIRVPKNQVSGTYSGELVDAASKMRLGTVTVRVSA